MFNLSSMKETLVARDAQGQIMWVRGRPDLSPMSYREWKEAENMESGWVVAGDGVKYLPPYTIQKESL